MRKFLALTVTALVSLSVVGRNLQRDQITVERSVTVN